MNILENIQSIKANIASCALKSGRSPNSIKLIAVSKTVSVENIQEAINAGIDALGENRVQEAISKQPYIKNNVEWHLIGHLQRNKVRYVVGRFHLIHSLESFNLAKAINDRALQNESVVNTLLEINISGEKTKFGINPGEARDFLLAVSDFSNLRVKGLMTVAPYADNPEEVRTYFKKMKSIYDSLAKLKLDNIDMIYLSMGMTNDYQVAIEEGANMVRIGTGIFGERK